MQTESKTSTLQLLNFITINIPIGIRWCLAGDYPPDSERPLALWPVAWLLVEPPVGGEGSVLSHGGG